MDGVKNLWDACEECGSSNLTFIKGQDKLTIVHCDECGDTWEDEYKEMWVK
jgi:translation initiation factor 2 beta subunit (eIF-2beta)/eIF-5